MELIESLEQLSLHVRSEQNRSQLRESTTEFSKIASDASSQLEEFESAIETLFSQINDFDYPQEASPATGKKRRRFMNHFLGIDEDAAIMQDTKPDEHSLVAELTKLDLAAITETVRKIGKILTLGNQIETIYKIHFLDKQYPNLDSMDMYSYRQICDTFISLCWSESCICDMPTIIRYNDYHGLLMGRLHDIMSSSQTSTGSRQSSLNSATDQAESSNGFTGTDPYYTAQTNHITTDEPMSMYDARDALDCALLESDSEQVNDRGWTTNQLYVTKFNNN